ncbi:MAG: TRAP transporter large permease subunit [Gracilibacteraceae bacterium]|jgi:tripartite ATP-independent transporter DctM subunit|nr:TRAP transporter large permease subunit [Gracilibacteraceae bacterium]
MSVELITVLMFAGVFIGVFMGFPVAFTLAGMGLIFGLTGWGPMVVPLLASKTFGVFQNYTYIAIPLFIFMGAMLDTSGVAETAFNCLGYWMRKIKGGVGIATLVLCIIFAACTGVVGASVTAMGLLALPAMLKRGYNHSLATGIVAAGGSLGILIPPSIMLVIFGPAAGISVVKLFSAAIVPGVGLGIMYILYTFFVVRLRKDMIKDTFDYESSDFAEASLLKGLLALVPFLFLIVAVLGMILGGVCAPTEAAATGALGSIILALAYRKLNWKTILNAAVSALKTSTMVYFIAMGANIFTAVFFGIGCNFVVEKAILGIGLGPWGTLIAVLLIVFILGMLIDWLGIMLIIMPIFLPILNSFGFDTLWTVMMIVVMLQTSFITPPFATSLFYLMGVVPPNVTTGEIYRGVPAFVIIILIMLVLMAIFPQITLWLPSRI